MNTRHTHSALSALLQQQSGSEVFAPEWAGAEDSATGAYPEIDKWSGLSRDLIERFIEVMCLEHSLPRNVRRSYRADLVALDAWMQRMHGRTLVDAPSADLRMYLDGRIAAGLDERLIARLLTSLHLFYQYLKDFGCRDDNAAARLPQAPWAVGAYAPAFATLRSSGSDI